MSKQSNFSRKLALDSPDRKPSVFERLGSKSCVVSGKNVCRSWAQNGTCPLNKSCKFADTHVLISPSKRSKTETMKKSAVVHKKSKDEHKKLRSHQSSEHDWESWEFRDLEEADEKVLEKRKQELERELQIHFKKEKELTRKKDKRSEKKRAASTSSSSSSTSETSTTSTSSSTSSSEPRKRQSRKRKHASSSSDSEVSPHRRKKSPKTIKGKVTAVKKSAEGKDRVVLEGKNKSVVVAKKSTVQKKPYSPTWDKSRGRTPTKQQSSKKSPHHSPDSKHKSSSPRYEKTSAKSKNRGFSPKAKAKDVSPKRTMKKVKDSSSHSKDKSRQSPTKTRTSPSRSHKVSPSRSRRHEESSDKRRSHYEDRKHSPRRDRSKEKDRKRDVRRGRSNDDDNGGLKKGGKILPLKPSSYNKDNDVKKDSSHHKSDKNSDSKSKDLDNDKDRSRADRDRNKEDKSERDRSKHKKPADEHDRRPPRDRDSDRSNGRGRDDRRDREADRLRYIKEREAERQKERDEALERCRERQRERERLEKERKEKEEKKHQRDGPDIKPKDYERELPSLMDLKAENPLRILAESNSKVSDKHLSRDCRRNLDKDKNPMQDRDGRDRGTPDKDHDRRDLRRVDDNDRRLGDKDFDRRNRDDLRNPPDVRRGLGDVRRGVDDPVDGRRGWDDLRRVMDPIHGRRSLDPISDRRVHPLVRRPDDLYRRGRESEMDMRDYPLDDRRGRKLMHPDWDTKDQNLDYRDPDVRDDWNHSDRHHEWNARYEHKWREIEDSRDAGWNHYPRRPPHDEWNNDWPQEQPRPLYPEERMEITNEEFNDINGKRHKEPEPPRPNPPEPNKNTETVAQEEPAKPKEEKDEKEGDALSDISDDPDDILNQDDEPPEENQEVSNTQQNTNQQLYVRSNEYLFDSKRPLLECLGERSLDFEEISDEELEEEARVSKGIIDVLGADWAGLVQETRPRPKRFESAGSAHRRWKMDSIISRLGISHKYAGEKFTQRLLEKYKNSNIKVEGKEEPTPMDTSEVEVKKENEEETKEMTVVKEEQNENVEYKVSVSAEIVPNESKPDVEIKILHPIPALHTAIKEAQALKSSLFQTHNRFKRALSARTDLQLRRELCNLPSKEPLHFTPPLDNKMYEASVQIFQGNFPMAAV